MNEEKARVFIQEEVYKELARQFWRAVAIVGIANVVALFGIWFSVREAAKDTAKAVAEIEARKEVQKNDLMVRVIEEKLKENTAGVFKSSNELDRLEKQLSDAKGRVKGLSELAAELDSSDQIRLGQLLIELKNSPTTQAFTEQIATMKRAVSGQVSPAARILSGSGFKVERKSVGYYIITFDQAFDSLPAVVVSTTAVNQYPQDGKPHAADTTINVSITNRKATVWCYTIDTNGMAKPVDEGFSFVAL